MSSLEHIRVNHREVRSEHTIVTSNPLKNQDFPVRRLCMIGSTVLGNFNPTSLITVEGWTHPEASNISLKISLITSLKSEYIPLALLKRTLGFLLFLTASLSQT